MHINPSGFLRTWDTADMEPLSRDIMASGQRGIVVPTSGSSGQPRAVAISAAALRHSAQASVQILGPEPWISALPVERIGGFVVWLRAIINGHLPPVIAPGEVTASTLQAAIDQCGTFAASGQENCPAPRVNISLIPTQLQRLAADPRADQVLARLNVLLGGAPASTALVQRATAMGAVIRRSYGMSETAAGCVIDGRPIPGVQVRISAADRIEISGPLLADGYLDDPAATARTWHTDDAGVRWLTTSDLGAINAAGALSVLGRADDLINTGGVKVSPQQIEASLAGWAGIGEACVVPIPDAEWGQAVVAVITLPDATPTPPLAEVRERVSTLLNKPSAPRYLLTTPQLPLLPSGKVDRYALRVWAQNTLRTTPSTGA